MKHRPSEIHPNKLTQNPKYLIGFIDANKRVKVKLINAISTNITMIISVMR